MDAARPGASRVLPENRSPRNRAVQSDEGPAPSPRARRADAIVLCLAGLLIIAIVAVLYLTRTLLMPIVTAFVIGTMLSAGAGFLARFRVPRALSALLMIGISGAAVATIVALISAPLLEWGTRLPELGHQFREKLHVFDRPLALWHRLQELFGIDPASAALPLPRIEWVQPTLEFLSPTFTELLLFFVTLILFVASWPDLRRSLIMTFPTRQDRLRVLRILNAIEQHLGSYLLTVTLINFGIGIATGLIGALTGLPNPAGLGALAATLNYIPLIGPAVMFIILLAVGVVTASTLGLGLLPPLLFAAVSFVEGHFVTPMIIGRRLSLNALAVFVAFAFWTWLWGPMGAFLSSPLLIVALIVKEHLAPSREPQLPPG
ncbi:AI-2E family transporter [Bradyrhizobium sp. U87765 SZCCT0131]|uniref:AI-2E family transporter n=1 Tax=Bradyrhizobium sp. U87765 SZCCT0109 TaxID=2807656 RepID=UPI001BA7BDB4|nr:AI-2E family transporter [Bradyrhizobium sp. U87765 SZCCT0131]MBR1263731.1 AI-2E family transporter [Bradyrhizobium sp. U87765 SZCCT0134]MBR1302699.1 AI-2E family transporter [Bradyrhizobium sp. U87765 SZCCT0110]MBR1319981.1 AI-2E family transporter [Bradyrhizobium sp. U87765 SZCCT0109]MBR1348906.1 AI-2E family transporter [Bradyrhizobium sp. U87765 SZCCT0048]